MGRMIHLSSGFIAIPRGWCFASENVISPAFSSGGWGIGEFEICEHNYN
ncbi:hypothetical protein BCH_02751 [Brucella sp. 191011898]|nr:hypothetical protein BCH_02751 [Brucella sp. 191011898]